VVTNSLAQYLTTAELDACLRDWRRLLRPGGRLILADVIPPQLGAVADATALLAFARRDGFLLAAVLGLARTLVSDYRTLRRNLGLARYGEDETLARLQAAGFTAERMPRNLGHNQGRMAFVGRVQD
jgi:ubiquinone/menaquinone biosynthesis C-methylase UbiE